MKLRTLVLQMVLCGLGLLPVSASADYEWCPIVRAPDNYQLVIEGVRCPVRQAKFQEQVLKVHYECLGPDGVRRGRFSGRQVGESRFKGRYLLESKLGRLVGPLEISFLSEQQLLMESRGKQYAADIVAGRNSKH